MSRIHPATKDRRHSRDASVARLIEHASRKDRGHDRNGVMVRVIECPFQGVDDGGRLYRWLTTVRDDGKAPAQELAALYHELWETLNVFDEFKAHLRGRQAVLRNKTPDLVEQELYGFLLAHFAIRSLMHEAAPKGDLDRLCFVHTVSVMRRKLPSLPPSPSPPLSIGPRPMKPFWRRSSSKNEWSAAEDAAAHAESRER